MATMLQRALHLRALGFSIIPVRPRDKMPLIRWKPHQKRRATRQEIRFWWGRWPDANIGIVTGPISGIVVIDADTPEARRWVRKNQPRTPIKTKTASGWHYYYRHPGGVVPSKACIRPGIDIRGDGGYIIAPGSVHPSGSLYVSVP